MSLFKRYYLAKRESKVPYTRSTSKLINMKNSDKKTPSIRKTLYKNSLSGKLLMVQIVSKSPRVLGNASKKLIISENAFKEDFES